MLPKEIDIPHDVILEALEYAGVIEALEVIEEAVSDYISDITGFCHNGFTLNIKVTAKDINYDIDEEDEEDEE